MLAGSEFHDLKVSDSNGRYDESNSPRLLHSVYVHFRRPGGDAEGSCFSS